MPSSTITAPITVPVNVQLSVLIKRESAKGREAYIAQCLEYDIAVQGDSVSELKKRLSRVIKGHIFLALEHGEEVFGNLPPAPAHLWEVWSDANWLCEPIPVTLPSDQIPQGLKNTPQRIPRGQALLRIA